MHPFLVSQLDRRTPKSIFKDLFQLARDFDDAPELSELKETKLLQIFEGTTEIFHSPPHHKQSLK